MFDLSLLPDALFEFVVITDTHYMLDVGDQPLEFESRRKQTARAEHALRLAKSLDLPLVIHLGDRAQEYHGTDRYRQAMTEAAEQIKRIGLEVRQVAGNQDVGDKPDPTMPAPHVSGESLNWFHENIGPSWYSFAHEGCHFIVLNSQIMNTDLPEAGVQQEWFEGDLEQNSSKRIFLFFHLPPYIAEETEPSLGHYDNLAEPARSWLLGLVRRYGIELMMTGHTHFAFFDRVGLARFYVCISPSFSRPAFPHVFTGSAPPEKGRDDAAKLGFYLVRVRAERTDVHFLRTGGEMNIPDDSPGLPHRLVTRTSAGFERTPLGITLRHPISNVVEAPTAWPAIRREKVRNDYPLLSCIELGAGWVRTPAADLSDPLQNSRLQHFREEGVKVSAISIWGDNENLPEKMQEYSDRADGWEIQIPGTTLPPADCLEVLKECQERTNIPITLSTLIPREIVGGKQHLRTRHGYRLDELAQLNGSLAAASVRIDRVLCRIGADESLWDVAIKARETESHSNIGAIDFAIDLFDSGDEQNCSRSAEALFAMALLPGSRLFFEPLITMDRTMDASEGLLDQLCNPRPTFHVLRCLNTVLFSGDVRTCRAREVENEAIRGFLLEDVALVLPKREEVEVSEVNDLLGSQSIAASFDLMMGTTVGNLSDKLTGPHVVALE